MMLRAGPAAIVIRAGFPQKLQDALTPRETAGASSQA
jgi:hypothetical protein